MKPVSRKALHSSNLLQDVALDSKNTLVSIKGFVKRLGENCRDALVILFNKSNFQPILVVCPDNEGQYSFLRLNTAITCFVVAFDRTRQYNAVIQDNVVPK
ncbi:hypothetical protein [Acinetobacter stercoris]|uniref:Uncharacterized protein n=1 Tax=Acinetobacter stercoris TaxID=2126983 RepID=A0A2U3N227_9GAMM|nr:hypothetical protein [Acinetobacter stercoris]SPL71737.1 hypothetical protein KPC_2915 [Acinetobacter stercoris]